MNTEKVIRKLSKALKEDEDYRQSWVSNIAMSYIDCESWYKRATGKEYLNREDKHTIANNAAEHFLTLLTK